MKEKQLHLIRTVAILLMGNQYSKVLMIIDNSNEVRDIVLALAKYTDPENGVSVISATKHVTSQWSIERKDSGKAVITFLTEDWANRDRGREYDLLVYYNHGLLCQPHVHYSVRLGPHLLVLRPTR